MLNSQNLFRILFWFLNLTCFITSIFFLRSLASVSVLFGQTIRGLSAGARVFEYLLIQPSIPISGGFCLPHDYIKGNVQFKHVKFAYPTREDQTVLSDFSLRIPAGTMVALCGPSGAGREYTHLNFNYNYFAL